MNLRFLVSMTLALFLSHPAYAADLDIKGIRLGMTKEELLAAGAVEDRYKAVSIPGFTIGGASEKYGKASLEFEDNKLVSLHFSFYSTWFDEVSEAVRAKYPKVRCRNEAMQNGFGARYTNTSCVVGDGKSLIYVSRFVNDTETGALSLTLKPAGGAQNEAVRKRKADI